MYKKKGEDFFNLCKRIEEAKTFQLKTKKQKEIEIVY